MWESIQEKKLVNDGNPSETVGLADESTKHMVIKGSQKVKKVVLFLITLRGKNA